MRWSTARGGRPSAQLMPRCLGDRKLRHLQRLADRREEPRETDLRIAQEQPMELARNGEDNVKVGHRQELTLSVRQPLLLIAPLTLRAVPIAAGVVRDLHVSARFAAPGVTAERSGPAAHNGAHCSPLLLGQRFEFLAMNSENVRELDSSLPACVGTRSSAGLESHFWPKELLMLDVRLRLSAA
jgi:hypothetical protein